jgi:limonene-1,2-epoxide hydrolase
MNAEARVREFCEAFARRDVEELLSFLAPDCVYHNIPMAPLTGHAAIEPLLHGFLRACTAVEFEVRGLASSGNLVLTERVDRFEREDGTRIELPVMGAFEVAADGKIAAWRDYFDMQMWRKQAGG